MTGGSTAVRGTGDYGMRVAGAAAKEMLDRGRGGAVRRAAPSECKASQLARHARGVRAERHASASSRRRRPSCRVPSSPALKNPDTLHDPAHGSPAPRHPVEGRRQRDLRHRLHAAGHAATPPSRSRRSTAASWCRSTPRPAEAMPGVKTRRAAGRGRRRRRRQLLARAQGARRAQAAVRRCRARRRVERVDLRRVRQGARRRRRRCRRTRPRSSPPTTACRFSRTRRWSRWCARRGSTATAPRSGPACRIRSTRAPPRRRRSASTSNRCTFTNLPLGGGFGRRLPFTFDYVDLGARIAKAMSPTPVKTDLEPRERHPARLLPPGRRWRDSPARSTRAARRSPCSRTTPAAATAKSVFMPYAIADKERRRRATRRTRSGLGAWRSVLNSQHGFFKESFIDEMAHAAGKDPYRLPARPADRSAALPGGAREASPRWPDWGTPAARGRGPRHRHRRELRLHRRRSGARGGVAGRASSACATSSPSVDCGDVVNTDTRHGAGGGRHHLRPVGGAARRDHHRRGTRRARRNFRDHQMIHIADAPHVSVGVHPVRRAARRAGRAVRAADRAGGRPTPSSRRPASACAICRSRTRRSGAWQKRRPEPYFAGSGAPSSSVTKTSAMMLTWASHQWPPLTEPSESATEPCAVHVGPSLGVRRDAAR